LVNLAGILVYQPGQTQKNTQYHVLGNHYVHDTLHNLEQKPTVLVLLNKEEVLLA